MEKTTWLPAGWRHPDRVQLTSGHPPEADRGHRVRPRRALGPQLQSRLWSIYGASWGWPPAMWTLEQDREDVGPSRHRDGAGACRSNYALFDTGEPELPGGIYVDQPLVRGTDAEISWWVVDWLVGGSIGGFGV